MLKQVLAVLVLAGLIEGASIEKAKMLNTHGLKDAAKQVLIDVIFGTSGGEAKADAYYYLGNIALTERNVTVAISTWSELVEKYPNSKRVIEVQQQIEVLRVGLSDTLAVMSENITAQLYLQKAEFWGMDYVSDNFVIQTVGLPSIEAGFKWLDKVIAEFPGTAEAEKAYEYKFFQLYDEVRPFSYDHIFTNNMNKLISLFEEFEAAFPKSTLLQMFRFQIAQLYFRHQNFEAADPWLNKIIETEGDRDSLYKQIAQYRLKIRKYP